MKKIIGRKVGMSQVFLENGLRLPVTVVEALPNKVLATKNKKEHGYDAVQVGVSSIKKEKLKKPQIGFFDKLKHGYFRFVKELRDVKGYKIGEEIKVDIFEPGCFVDVQGISKGKGFTGAIKRWNFSVGSKSHGAGYPHRYQGSVSFGRGGSQGQRVPKGKKMAGQYGHELVTISHLMVVKNDQAQNLILLKGSVPGPVNGWLVLKTTVKKQKKTTFASLAIVK